MTQCMDKLSGRSFKVLKPPTPPRTSHGRVPTLSSPSLLQALMATICGGGVHWSGLLRSSVTTMRTVIHAVASAPVQLRWHPLTRAVRRLDFAAGIGEERARQNRASPPRSAEPHRSAASGGAAKRSVQSRRSAERSVSANRCAALWGGRTGDPTCVAGA